CYARTVIHQEWPKMEAGTLGDIVNPWGVATFRTLKTVEPKSASEQAAYAKWLDQRSDRDGARDSHPRPGGGRRRREAHDPLRRPREPDQRLRSTTCLQTSALRRRLFARQRAPDRRERSQGRAQRGPENFAKHCSLFKHRALQAFDSSFTERPQMPIGRKRYE